jgi:multidrug efflux pump
VLIPLLFMGDVVGRLFREFAVTLASPSSLGGGVADADADDVRAPASSHAARAQQGRFFRGVERIFDQVIDAYARSLRWVLARQRATLLVAVAVLILTGILYAIVPKGFFPIQDTGVILGISEGPQSVSFPAHGRAPAGARARDPRGSGRRQPVVVHRHRRHETRRSTAAACSST